MFGLESLDILIGLVTIYLTTALACTALVEVQASLLNIRSKNLKAALSELLAGDLKVDTPLIDAFYSHPLVLALSKDTNGLPAYIPPQVVGQVMQALITANNPTPSVIQAVMNLPGTEEDNRIKGLLITLATQAKDDVEAFRKAVESHFDAVMDRASGWVKRRQQWVALGVATVFVLFGNIDTFELVNKLSSNPELRAKVLIIAESLEQQPKALFDKDAFGASESTSNPTATETQQRSSGDAPKEANPEAEKIKKLPELLEEFKKSGLTWGWKNQLPTLEEINLMKSLGLLISILAISLGAPFWFDVLQRFMQVRATGISPREKEKNRHP